MPGDIVRVGFACVLADGSLSTSHTFRLASLSPERLQATAARNLADLRAILQQMEQGPLRMLRLGSSLVPFASHPAMTFDWEPFVAEGLAEIGSEYRAKGFRFSLHPGQYNVLNSPNPATVDACVRELTYACRVLDLMGCGHEHKVVLHGGGLYGDREGATSRLVSAIGMLPACIRKRLVLENDERYFNLEQILEVSEATGTPAVFDLHHHQVNPSPDAEALLERLFAVWDCRPKIHLSSQKPDARAGAHDDYLLPQDIDTMRALIPGPADLMVEAKAKDLAAIRAVGHLTAKQ